MTETLCRAGLILEGGGMRGVYTAGVLDCFLDEGLFFNRCYGVSAGAGQACSYLSRAARPRSATAMDYLRDKPLREPVEPAQDGRLLRGGVFIRPFAK